MNKEFVMRGQTASGQTEVLNFSGYKPGYAYRLVEFQLFPSVLGVACKLAGSITSAKTYEDPTNQNFTNEGLIGSGAWKNDEDSEYGPMNMHSVINDTFLITQNLILAVIDNQTGSPMAVNWQCRFVAEKMSGPEEAVANYKQFTISDE